MMLIRSADEEAGAVFIFFQQLIAILLVPRVLCVLLVRCLLCSPFPFFFFLFFSCETGKAFRASKAAELAGVWNCKVNSDHALI